MKMRFDAATGRFVPVEEPRETAETTEAAERPAFPDDPRPAASKRMVTFGPGGSPACCRPAG